MVSGYVGYVHPCGAVSVGAIPRKKETAQDKRHKIVHRSILNRKNNLSGGTESADGIARLLQAREISVTQAVTAYSDLGLSSLQNSRIPQTTSNQLDDSNPKHPACKNPSKRYGQNGISRLGRVRAKDGAALLEKGHGKNGLAFATVTMPLMSEEQLKIVCEKWGEYQHRLVEEIKRELVRHNVIPEIIYVTEIQEKRYIKYGQIAPHLHLVFPCYELDIHGKKTGKFAITADKLREIHERVLRRITGEKNINVKASVDIQKIKKSTVGYLGKYMSKGGAVVAKIKEDGRQNELPRSWWGCTKELRIKIQKSIIKVTGNKAKNLFFNINKLVKMGVIKKYCQVSQNRTYFDTKRNETITADITYGLYGQLNPKLNHQKQLIIGILDICDIVTDDCIDDICKWISAMNTAQMVDDICNILIELKELLLDENPENILINPVTGEIIELKVNEKINYSKVYHKSLFTDNSVDKVLENMY